MFLDDVPQTPADGGMPTDDGMVAGAGEDTGEMTEAKKDKEDDDDGAEGGAAM